MDIVILYTDEQSFLVQCFDDFGPRLCDIHAFELAGNRQQFPVKIDNLLLVQAMALGNLKVQ